jgi:hypothetical protein
LKRGGGRNLRLWEKPNEEGEWVAAAKRQEEKERLQ